MAPLEIDLLTEDEKIAQTCRDYWDCDENGKFRLPVAQVAKDHGLKNNEVTGLVHQNCNVFSADYICSNCGDMPDIENRSVYLQIVRSGGKEIVCPSCQEEINRLAKTKHEEKLACQREAIRQQHPLPSGEAPDVHSLTLEDVVYLISFVRAVASEDLRMCLPLSSSTSTFAPTPKYSNDIVVHLYRKGLIKVHPESSINAFVFEEDDSISFYPSEVHWTLMTGTNAHKTRPFIAMLENTLRNPELRPFSWHDETHSLWQKVAYHECIEYLELCMNEHGFELKIGPKTQLMIENSLQSFSVSQVYGFVWGAVTNAAAFFVRMKNRTHAANTIVGSIQRKAEKCQAEGWDATKYHRDRRRPRTIVSEVLFDAALKIGSTGFDEKPRPVISANVE